MSAKTAVRKAGASNCRASLLGLFEDGDYHDMRVALEPGELLIVASDGCTEAENLEG